MQTQKRVPNLKLGLDMRMFSYAHTSASDEARRIFTHNENPHPQLAQLLASTTQLRNKAKQTKRRKQTKERTEPSLLRVLIKAHGREFAIGNLLKVRVISGRAAARHSQSARTYSDL